MSDTKDASPVRKMVNCEGGSKSTEARVRLIFSMAYPVRPDTKPYIPTQQSNYRVVKVNPATVKPIFAPLFNSPPLSNQLSEGELVPFICNIIV